MAEMGARLAGVATAAGGLGLAAVAGASDVALHGVDFTAGDALGTLALWLVLALPAALAVGTGTWLCALALRNRARPEAVAAFALAGLLVGGGVFGASNGSLGPAPAGALAVAALAGFALRPPGSGWLKRAPVLALLLCALSALAALVLRPGDAPQRELPTAPAARADARPHVVVIVLDTQRVDRLGAYGNPSGLSPAFDALAARSTLYEQCYSTAAWTVPAHASLFTGLHPISHGASFEHHRWLDDDFTTLAEALREAGYRTVGLSANPHVALANLAQGFESYSDLGAGFQQLWIRKLLAVLGGPERWMDQGAADAARRVEALLAEGERDSRPLFLFVNLLEPHWRYLPPLAERREELPSETSWLRATLASVRFYGPLAMARGEDRIRKREMIAGLYDAEVRYQDRQFARIVAAIDEHLGVAETLLVVTSDHGENLGEGGRWDHVFAVNDHLIHVPMLVRHPPRFPAGRREPGMCQLSDVPATVADVVGGLELEPGSGARSLAPDAFEPHAHVVAEGDPYLGHLERMSFAAGLQRDVGHFAASLTAIRDGRYKWVDSTRGPGALYDLHDDPDELRDIAKREPERAAELQRALDVWRSAQRHYGGAGPPSDGGALELDAREREQLERLGYTQ